MKRSHIAAALLTILTVTGCGSSDDGNEEGSMRGVIEGFYGTPYSFEQRLDLLRFLPRAGLDTYVYAPKSDPFHRSRWREPYPTEFLDHFAALAAAGETAGVRFVFALSPGPGFEPGDADTTALHAKLGTLLDVGVRDFCLLFDDITANSGAADPQVQVDLVTATRSFLRARDPGSRLCFISHYYAGTADEIRAGDTPFDGPFAVPSAAAYDAYAAIPTDVPILWTGRRVFSHLTVDETAAVRELVGRPLVIWDNFPVNDIVLARELFLSPYREREAGIADVAGGLLLNTMLQPEASKIALWTAGRFLRDGPMYDPDAALAEAFEELAGGSAGAAVLARLAEQFRSHPFIGYERESPALADRAAAFFATRSSADEQALRTLLASFAAIAGDFPREVRNAALVAELGEPVRKLSLLGSAGLLGLDLLAQQGRGEAVDLTALRAQLHAIDAIPWLVGANTLTGAELDELLAGRPANRADVFGDFFGRVLSELG